MDREKVKTLLDVEKNGSVSNLLVAGVCIDSGDEHLIEQRYAELRQAIQEHFGGE